MVRVGIVGATGYAGRELIRHLLRHPHVTISYLAARRLTRPTPVGRLYPQFARALSLDCRRFALSEALAACDVLILGLPPGLAMTVVPAALRAEKFVIDLSGDYRLLSAGAYRRAYGARHRHPHGLPQAVYGLPELYRDHLPATRLVANPGCYPTASLLAAAPLVARRLVEPDGVIVDAKSGVTGAGRTLTEELLFTEVHEELHAYKVNAHQHQPEIAQELSRLGRRPIACTFVPHLVPMNQGLYATVYLRLRRRVAPAQVQRWYEAFYRQEPFVRVLGPEAVPKTHRLLGTNDAEVAVRVAPGGRLAIALAAIDNLGKGAAGQAVQNLNLMLGFDETAGLP